MKTNTLKRWMTGIAVPLFLLAIVPGLSLARDGESYFQEGTKLLKQGELDQAAAALTEAIRLVPDHEEAYNNRGLAYFEQKDYALAKQDFFMALRLSPFDKQANNNLGILFCGQEDYDRALPCFQRAIEKSGAPTSYDMIVYRNLAYVYAKKGMQEEAAEAYAKAQSIQDKVSGDLELRPYGDEGTRDYTLTLDFSTARTREKRKYW
jgi:Tfp pilus assembly protein PilF